MAVSTQGPSVWYTNTAGRDFRAFDLEELVDGQIMVAFGGSSSVNPALHTGLLDLGTGQLGPLTTTTWAPTGFSGTVPIPGAGDYIIEVRDRDNNARAPASYSLSLSFE